MRLSSDASMVANCWIDVALLGPRSQPILMSTHVEEGRVRVHAARVPRVNRELSVSLILRFLNVPEDVLGQPFESFHRHRLFNGRVEGTS